jgi:hypothetical protein
MSVNRRFLLRAALWSLAFGIAHLLGFREYTAVLSGTASLGAVQVVFAGVYLVLYLGFVFLVPALLIAPALLAVVGLARKAIRTGGTYESSGPAPGNS